MTARLHQRRNESRAYERRCALIVAGMKAFHLNAAEQRGEPAGAVKPDGSFSVALKANTKAALPIITPPDQGFFRIIPFPAENW